VYRLIRYEQPQFNITPQQKRSAIFWARTQKL
jgi:hypothetical protein